MICRYSVEIVTDPRQGPFRHGQRVQFSCVVNPAPPNEVNYQWRMVERIGAGDNITQQSFNRSYDDYNLLHSCYYYCEVAVNQTVLGSASRIVEIQGKAIMTKLICWVGLRGRVSR